MRGKLKTTGINLLASLAGSLREPLTGRPESFLVIRRNRMGDMICTVPLLHALRREFPQARITVACDPEGEPIARACPAVTDVYVMCHGLKLYSNLKNARQLQGHDATLAVKVGFDRRLASLARMTQSPLRIGFERMLPKQSSLYYTHALPPPLTPAHQIESCLRLLRPLGIVQPEVDLTLRLPDAAMDFAGYELQNRHYKNHAFFAVINISSTQPLKWPMKNFKELAQRLCTEQNALVALASTPADRERASRVANEIGSPSVFVPETASVLELAALIRSAAFVFTPEGGVGHLAAAFDRPALIFWSGGPFNKWNTRGAHHRNIRADLAKKTISVDEVWDELTTHFLPIGQSTAAP
jgi:ADP-heptose:LPS heptosyltransferase